MEEINSTEESENITWAIIGNKCDLKTEVRKDAVKLLCEELSTTLEFQTSAKEGLNVQESFEKTVRAIHRHQNSSKPKLGLVDIEKEPRKKESSSSQCC